MWPESEEHPRPLRTGLTTGCCATACCVAAARLALTQQHCQRVSVTLPRGQVVELDIIDLTCESPLFHAATIKDAGDDPDVTHGAKVFVRLQLSDQPGVQFKAGDGVGTVTKPGLMLEVGEAAINPVPRQMISQHLEQIANESGFKGGFIIEVGVEHGAELALKTMNPRLGILGGLSILGTTGIVRPFSCAAYIASIRQGVDVARTNGQQHIAATTGNTSEDFIRANYQLPEMALIEMGDFVGALLKHLKRNPVERLTLGGGFGKLSKLAQGHLDLHSSKSSISLEYLRDCAADLGADQPLQQAILDANTSVAALKLCQQADIALGDRICAEAARHCRQWLATGTRLDVHALDRKGNAVGYHSEVISQ
ncbi:cobalt-precorrin-5B (C(1))-methyltransferase [Marinobacterium jannaschii]|uniref:cobalt-precorrin-5B (C(1))-methyltransferase n=1 Tax=Marinobacterium jannaschii TaxID=64970 RepID=UPI000480A641|nr:cobalt-precorrin-5B (C(1))-methyltransferase [Marinobacterium jannaschii]